MDVSVANSYIVSDSRSHNEMESIFDGDKIRLFNKSVLYTCSSFYCTYLENFT